MKLAALKKKKPSQAEYDYFKFAKFPKFADTHQLLVKPVKVDDVTESGIITNAGSKGEYLPCGYVLVSNCSDIEVGDLIFWSSASVFNKFEVTDLKAEGGQYIQIFTNYTIYAFPKSVIDGD